MGLLVGTPSRHLESRATPGARMSDICGIIGDLKREDQGVYVFPRLTLLGYDSKEPQVQRLLQLGYKVGDEDSRYEGVEIKGSSPFQLMRTLAKEFNYRPLKPVFAP